MPRSEAQRGSKNSVFTAVNQRNSKAGLTKFV